MTPFFQYRQVGPLTTTATRSVLAVVMSLRVHVIVAELGHSRSRKANILLSPGWCSSAHIRAIIIHAINIRETVNFANQAVRGIVASCPKTISYHNIPQA
jgi:hypothetical protein